MTCRCLPDGGPGVCPGPASCPLNAGPSAEERLETAEDILRDVLRLLNDQPRFLTRNRALDSYKVAARIDTFFSASNDGEDD
ncbi:MAG: hypothetical protein ACK53W_12515 [Gemmatimonadota bacterium]